MSELFGTLSDGTRVHRWTLERAGVRVRVLTYGGIVQSAEVPDRDGRAVDVTLGFPPWRGTRPTPSRISARWSGGTRTGSGAPASRWTG